VVGYEGFYEVSDYGNVRSLPRDTKVRDMHRASVQHDETWHRKGKILTPLNMSSSPNHRYWYVRLTRSDGTSRTTVAIKKLVAETFFNYDGPSCNIKHIDGRADDCSAPNLIIVNKVQREIFSMAESK